MNNDFLRTCLCASLGLLACAQPMAQTYYQRVYGGFSNERIYCSAATVDSCVVAGGYTSSFVSGNNSADLLVMKCDNQGDMLWSKHFDLGLVGNAAGIIPAPDGGLVVTGTNNHIVGVVLKLDSDGAPVWGRRNNSVDTYFAPSISTDSSVFIVGETNGGNTDIVVDKLAWDGSPMWSIRYGSNYDEEAKGIVATQDGGALITGGALVSQPESDGLLLKLDGAGNVQWCKSYGLSGVCDVLHDAVECTNGGFLAVGSGCFSTTWPLIVRTDALGDTLWTRRLNDNQGRATEVTVTSYGYLISGNSTGAPQAIFMVGMDDQGNILWDRRTYEYENDDGAALVHPDGRAVMVGDIVDGGIGLWDVLIATFSATGIGSGCNETSDGLTALPTVWQLGTAGALLTPTSTFAALPNDYDCTFLEQTLCASSVGMEEHGLELLSAFPNPTTGHITIDHPIAGLDEFTLTDATGRVVMASTIQGQGRTTRVDLSACAPGIYVLQTNPMSDAMHVLRIVKE